MEALSYLVGDYKKPNKFYYNSLGHEYNEFMIYKYLPQDWHVIYKNTNIVIACRNSLAGAKQAIDNLLSKNHSDNILYTVEKLKLLGIIKE